jgi:hypothetical protein
MRKQTFEKPAFTTERITGGLVNDEVKCKPKKVPKTPPHLPKLHVLCGAFGVVRSGKSNALVNLIQAYWDCGSLNWIACISPTYESNPSLQTLPFKKEDIYTDSRTANMALDSIIEKIKNLGEDYFFEKAYKKAYDHWMNGTADEKEMVFLSKMSFRPPKNPLKWPAPGIFIDDMTHTELMANSLNNKLSHLALHHRHLGQIGVSIFAAFQTFHSGMPRVIRQNLGLIILFATCDRKALEEIHREICNNISFDTFLELFCQATEKDHGFLLVDKLARDVGKQYGINFDEKFVLDMNAERRKVLKLK